MIIRDPYDQWEVDQPTAVSIGVFDGVHIGHRHIFRQLVAAAADRQLEPAILTFDRHPMTAIDPGRTPKMIDPTVDRLGLLEHQGAAFVAVLEFDDHLRLLSADDFCEAVLVEAMAARLVVVGGGFRFGHNASGDIETLRRRGSALGFDVIEANLLHDGPDVVSSSRIRELIEDGNFPEANRLLGRPFRRGGAVVEGDHRGAAIGFPTANLAVTPGLLVPANGVYICTAHHAGRDYRAAVNVGVRPTFGGGRRVIEAHLLDFGGDLHGEMLQLDFLERIRAEKKFDGTDELVEQIEKDVEYTRTRLI